MLETDLAAIAHQVLLGFVWLGVGWALVDRPSLVPILTMNGIRSRAGQTRW